MQVAWLQLCEGSGGQAGTECACSRVISLCEHTSLSYYVSTLFLFHTGVTDIQFHTLYSTACSMTMVTLWFPTLDSGIVQCEYPRKKSVLIQLMSGNTERSALFDCTRLI